MEHTNSTQETGKGGIPISAFALGALAGAIAGILLAPKAGRETREDIKETLATIKDDIAERLSELKEVTQEKYHSVVDAVVEGYQSAKHITAQQASEIKADLAEGYDNIKQAAGKAKNQAKSNM